MRSARSARRVIDMKQKGSRKGITRGSVDTASPTHLPPSRSSRRGAGSHALKVDALNDDDDEVDIDGRRGSNSRRATTRSAVGHGIPIKKKPEFKRNERKASVRKETYEIDDSGSDLTDAPEQGFDEDGDTESDGEMAKKLQEAGDGESLLGSAASDRDDGDTDEEEERFIIQDVVQKQARRKSRRSSTSVAQESSDEEDEVDEDDRRYRDGTLSPRIMEQLGLDGFDDDMFAPQDPFHSSSEPSFTDFFGSGSEDETEEGLGLQLKPRLDDNDLTTDDEDSDVTDISDLDESMLSAPFLAREALAAGVSTQVAGGGTGAEMMGADVPLLVIEDLDGRLIYARAGDGEAVFGSDGEFECIDDSDEDDTDEDMDGLGFDYRSEEPWVDWRGSKRRAEEDAIDSDEGDTTDELPNEDMPFPRLLIGSVAPHGGRNARRARAMAAKSKRGRTARSRAETGKNDKNLTVASTQDSVLSTPTTPEERVQELDFSISTEALARDPQATLEAAAKTLGLTAEEVARLVAGLQQEGPSPSTTEEPSKIDTPVSKPKMGSFMPSSFKSVRRAVIDGNRQAPSPFSSRYSMQKRGLSGRTRRPSTTTPSSKRIRRLSTLDGNSQIDGAEDMSEALTSSHEGSPIINPMELDDVLDASMLWRGSHSSSPPASVAATGMEDDQKTPVVRAAKRPSNTSTATSTSPAGLNLNAFARWHRIPMGAFRDGQGAGSSSMAQQPLGSFLLTRSSRADQSQSSRKSKANQNHSPFRGRGEGDSIHLGAAPLHHGPSGLSDAFAVSPVLWPTKHGSKEEGHDNAAIWYTPKVVPQESQGKLMTTKREKRQKRARKAALKAALQGVDGETSPSVLDSPATAMPRLSIADDTSPLMNTKASLPALQSTSTSMPMDIPSTTATLDSHPISHSMLSTSGSNGSLQQPPSSVFGVPLHSPLFSGIMDPPNLGFRDDLEDRDGLTI
jgi:hypothetical protein